MTLVPSGCAFGAVYVLFVNGATRFLWLFPDPCVFFFEGSLDQILRCLGLEGGNFWSCCAAFASWVGLCKVCETSPLNKVTCIACLVMLPSGALVVHARAEWLVWRRNWHGWEWLFLFLMDPFNYGFFNRSCIFGLALTFGKVACSRHKYLTMEMDTTWSFVRQPTS